MAGSGAGPFFAGKKQYICKNHMTMRNFVCKASKALFLADLDFTYNFRNDCVEFIVKQDRGVYGVLNLIPCEEGWQILARFGALFEILGDKKALKKVLPQMPVLSGLVENEGSFEGLSLLNHEDTLVLGKVVPFEGNDFLDSLTSAPLGRSAWTLPPNASTCSWSFSLPWIRSNWNPGAPGCWPPLTFRFQINPYLCKIWQKTSLRK